MSLTREEWIAMWDTTIRLELLTGQMSTLVRIKVLHEVKQIQTQIQDVIGQMR